jgi:type IV pilus assembly protein PilV
MSPQPHIAAAGTAAHRQSRQGFTLLETLIAMVVLTVGMLGQSLLYVEALRLNRTAIHRARAIGLAADMAERMLTGVTTADIMIRCVNSFANCNGTGVANDEAAEWLREVAAQLPIGTMTTIRAAAPAASGTSTHRYDITLRWPDAGRTPWASYTLTILSAAR